MILTHVIYYVVDLPVDKIALLIGNRQYQDKDIPKLRTPEMDTQDLAEALFNIGFKVNG